MNLQAKSSLRLGVLISGGGTTLKNFIDKIDSGELDASVGTGGCIEFRLHGNPTRSAGPDSCQSDRTRQLLQRGLVQPCDFRFFERRRCGSGHTGGVSLVD